MSMSNTTTTTTTDGGEKLHIAVFPWLAMGHMLPFLELSKRIAMEGHRVSFLCTTRNIQRLPTKDLSPLVQMIHLSLPRVANLPETAEATIDLPTQGHRVYLRAAYDGLEEQVREFLIHQVPDWVLIDYAPYWVTRVAKDVGVACAYFGLFSGSVLGFIGPPEEWMESPSRTKPEDFMVPPKWVLFETNVAFRAYEARAICLAQDEEIDSGVSEGYRFAASIKGCKLVALRSCYELESNWVDLLCKIYNKPIIPAGLLPPLKEDASRGNGWSNMYDWLDKQNHASVVYAAFGSESKLSKTEVLEIAKGLELSEVAFVWALRIPEEVDDHTTWLPEGFEERTQDRGVICRGWAPQVKILAHRSIGGFLTHAGWNSIVEGLAFARALVLLPLMFDQGLNSISLEEKGVGIEVKRNDEDGSFAGKDIAEALRMVMVAEEGKVVRERAAEAKDIFGDEILHRQYVQNFLKQLRDHGS